MFYVRAEVDFLIPCAAKLTYNVKFETFVEITTLVNGEPQGKMTLTLEPNDGNNSARVMLHAPQDTKLELAFKWYTSEDSQGSDRIELWNESERVPADDPQCARDGLDQIMDAVQAAVDGRL